MPKNDTRGEGPLQKYVLSKTMAQSFLRGSLFKSPLHDTGVEVFAANYVAWD